jgi:hypothetical protein
VADLTARNVKWSVPARLIISRFTENDRLGPRVVARPLAEGLPLWLIDQRHP